MGEEQRSIIRGFSLFGRGLWRQPLRKVMDERTRDL